MPKAKRRKPEMILAVPPTTSARETETVPGTTCAENAETATGEAEQVGVDPREIAERVYRLMCAEYRVERDRRGWM